VATGMLVDLFSKRCDITIVVSADSDISRQIPCPSNFFTRARDKNLKKSTESTETGFNTL
jgi:hypothetical protein